MDQDPSLVLDSEIIEMCRGRQSILLNIAATFQYVFEGKNSIEGILKRMKELAAKQPSNEEEFEFVFTAKKIVKNIEALSPLTVKVVQKTCGTTREAKFCNTRGMHGKRRKSVI